MRTEQEIRRRLAEIARDERMSYPSASVIENAPLALIQVQGESAVEALRWVLGEAATCAGCFPSRQQRFMMAASVRGEAVHARWADERVALCGVQNVSVVEEPFVLDSAWSCARCVALVRKLDPIVE